MVACIKEAVYGQRARQGQCSARRHTEPVVSRTRVLDAPAAAEVSAPALVFPAPNGADPETRYSSTGVPGTGRQPAYQYPLPSLAVGGAERSVLETLQGLAGRAGTANLFLTKVVEPYHELKNIGRARVFHLYQNDIGTRLRQVAMEVLASPAPVLFTHLVKARQLRTLWQLGVTTVPVVHNSRPSWQDQPQAFDHPRVPFVAAVSENVAEQLRADGCPKPIAIVRHETQRWFSLEELKTYRKEVRGRYSIPDRTLLIGMVGGSSLKRLNARSARAGGGPALSSGQTDDPWRMGPRMGQRPRGLHGRLPTGARP